MNCRICSNELQSLDEHAAICKGCNSLHNTAAQVKDYIYEGGQEAPNPSKQYWRQLNACFRFNLLMPYISEINSFVDIGCGSGEMLVEAGKLGLRVYGFDTNKPLARFVEEQYGYLVSTKIFKPGEVSSIEGGRLFSLAHVLEHMEAPMEFLADLFGSMRSDDLCYIEVPLFTGQSFKEKGYGWSLWYEEHFELFSLETLDFIASELEAHILDRGTRVFSRGSVSRGMKLKLARRHPIKTLSYLFYGNKRLSLADELIADYGWIVLKK